MKYFLFAVKLTGIIILGLLIAGLVSDVNSLQQQLALAEAKHTQQIPTPSELQQMLVNEGCDIGGDGVDGVVGPNTIKGWDRWECQQSADKYNYYYQEKPNGK